MKNLFLTLFLFGIISPAFAQITEPEELKEVKLVAVNYKYLDAVTKQEVAIPVRKLEQHVANYDIKSSEVYHDDYDMYEVTFFIPEGSVLAAYDRDGKLIRTIERYKNAGIPDVVRQAVNKKYPDWSISKDVYLVNYHDAKGAERQYKLKLENGKDVVRIKTDERGNIL
ncbi:nicotinate-nucleotide adenylyltransferase [Salinimicrobium sp. CAU 1759]